MASAHASRLFQLSHHRPRIYAFEHLDACPFLPLPSASHRHGGPPSDPRPFSTSPSLPARASSQSGPRVGRARAQPAIPSPVKLQKIEMQAAIRSGAAFAAMGVAPDTFITLPLSKRPSFLHNYRDRWTWEVARLRSRMKTVAALAYFKFWIFRTRNPKDVVGLTRSEKLKYRLFEWYGLEMFKVAEIARGMYEKMYEALAEGKVERRLEQTVKDDLMDSLKNRVESRGRLMRTEWRLEEWLSKPKVVSYTVLCPDPSGKPGWEQSFLQQAVVRMESKQAVRRWIKRMDAKGVFREQVANEESLDKDGWPPAKRVEEYVVLHKSVVDGKQGRWMIWGMTKPTTVLDVKRDLRSRLGLPNGEPL
ncbi:CRAL-TRIO domain-containing protein [Sphaceloma murrayae]|uniref:CRAL-TRIO domain-containing protein n=1 Tax=Sphaceloma murrayae TaxID=2082308 RepID=A0A2K1QXP1_9PEZI|nr:CRAL-TRIO domain-containing protein [Sphaceloma murrayae]